MYMTNLKSSQAAIDLIVTEEIGSPTYYQEHYQHPDWPGGESGVTIGIGYDCGYSKVTTIMADWGDKLPTNMVSALASVAGIHGAPAHSHAHELHFVTVPFGAAMDVFRNRDMPKWERIVVGSLPNTDKLSPDSFGALISLAYNRGASFGNVGDRYTEMRTIKALMAAERFDQIPAQFLAMKRLWPTMRGLRNRREHEATLFQKGLA